MRHVGREKNHVLVFRESLGYTRLVLRPVHLHHTAPSEPGQHHAKVQRQFLFTTPKPGSVLS